MTKSPFIIHIIYVLCLLIINPLNAQTASCGGYYSGSLTYSSDSDYYSITLSSSYTWIKISTCGSSFDTEVALLDSAYSQLCSCDDCGSCSTSFHEELTYYSSGGFSYGTYRIKVYPHGSDYGSYALSVECGSGYATSSYCESTPSPYPTTYCDYDEYQCSYSYSSYSSGYECIPSSWVCDDDDDCDNGDDEDDCSSSSSTYVWIFAVIGVIVIVCIVYFVWYQNKQKARVSNNVVSSPAAKANVVSSAKPAQVMMQPTANIKYVDQNGNPVAAPTVGGAITGNPVTAGAPITAGPNIKYVDQNGNPVAPPTATPGGNIKYVDQNGNPVAAPSATPGGNIKYVDQNGNPVAAPVAAPPTAGANIKYVDQFGNPVAPPTNQPQQIIQAAPSVKYVDQFGNPVAPPTATPQPMQPMQVSAAPPPGNNAPGEGGAPPAYAAAVPEADAPPPAYSNVMGDTAGSAPPEYEE